MSKESEMKVIAQEVLGAVGGAENIEAATHCYTRLRLTVKEKSGISENTVKAINGVLGLVIRGNEYQVVIGPDVSTVYLQFESLLGNSAVQLKEPVENEDTPSKEATSKSEDKESKSLKAYLLLLLDFIGGTFSPVIPVLIAGGLTGAVLTILTNFFNVTSDSGTYTVFYAVNQAAFYFLPVFIGFSAARKLNINSYLGAMLGCVLLYSTINGAEGLDFFGIGIHTTTYNTTVFPILLGVGFMAIIYKFFEKRLAKSLKTVFLPLLTIIITVPVVLIVLGPIGDVIGTYLSNGIFAIYEAAPFLAVMIIGAATPFLVFFGMNNALYPIIFALFAAQNNDPLIVAGMLSANLSVGATCLAVSFKTKNIATKTVSFSAGITGLLGITEPGVYGVLFPLKRPLIAATIGGAVGGLFAGLFKIAGYAIVSPSFASIVAFIPNDGSSMMNFYYALAVAAISIVVSFIAMFVIGLDEKENLAN